MWILYVVLVISLVINVVGIIFVRNAIIKITSYDAFFTETQKRIAAIINTMKSIDIRGSFEADDEIGGVFQQMNMLVQSLDVFLLNSPREPNTNE